MAPPTGEEAPLAPPPVGADHMAGAMGGSMGDAGLFESLVMAFPQGLMEDRLAHALRGRVRGKLREIGYRVDLEGGEEWQTAVENFAIA
eukprot:3205408-Alexandrium_andersonii.AAC.1